MPPPPATEQRTKQVPSEPAQAALPSEETVDAFLESVLKTDVVASLHAPPAPNPASPSAPTSTASGPSARPEATPARGKWDPALLSSTRALLLPQLLANARARRPDGQWDKAAAASRAQALLTDDWCEEMIALARRAREEMRRRVAEAQAARGVSATTPAASRAGVGGDVETSGMDTWEDGVQSANTPGPSCVREDVVGEEDASMDLVEPQPKPSEERPAEDVRMDVAEDRTEPPMPQDTRGEGRGAPLAQPAETMLGTAARVLQDFLAKTPRPRSEVLPEADAGPPHADESAHEAGPSSVRSPHPLEQAQPQEVAHTPTAQTTGSGLWALQMGSNLPRITTVTFDVQETVAAAVQRWARRHGAFE